MTRTIIKKFGFTSRGGDVPIEPLDRDTGTGHDMTIPKLRRLHNNFQTRFQGPDMQQTQIQVGVHCRSDIVSRFTNVLTK